MANNPDQENTNAEDHVVDMQVIQDRLTRMHQKLADSQGTLSRLGRSSCCIFKVPQNLVDINGRCYQPDIVSIGPYHHGDSRLGMIEEHKWRFLNHLLKRTERIGTLEGYFEAVQQLEAMARKCYSAPIEFPTDEFIEMLVLDGCFVIELFRKFDYVDNDPLLSLSWVHSFFIKDLIRLENQIPSFILNSLFDLTQMPGEEGRTLPNLTLNFFRNGLLRSNEVVNDRHLQGEHLLDFLRTSFFPVVTKEPKINLANPHEIPCISKLRMAGIKLRAGSNNNLLLVEFKHGVIEMPTITMNDFMSAFLLNCVAYEQCHRNCPRYVTTYAKLLDCLINSAKDVEYLCDKNIIANYFGTEDEIAKFINNMGKEVQFDIGTYLLYLSDLLSELKDYYNSNWNVQLASFKSTYFNTPWSFISAVAALVLLILTATQTYYTVFTYFRQR